MKHLIRRRNLVCIIIITLFTLWTVIPIFMMVSQALKPERLMFTDPPTIFFTPILTHFFSIFSRNNIFLNIVNSGIVGAATMVLCVTLGVLCAYALSRIRIPGAHGIALLILITRMIPVSSLMMPIYVMMRKLGISGTHLAVILAHTTLNLPFAILMMKGFFQDIPMELEEAAQVDGCSRLHTFLRICLPLVAPGLATTSIMVLLNSWNEFMFALILSGRATRTLAVGISAFLGSVSIDWGSSSAAATLATLPIFIAGIFIQKYFVRGLTGGAVKG